MSNVLVTTPWLEAGGPVDERLESAGFQVARRPIDQEDRFSGIEFVIAGTEPFSGEEIARSPSLRLIVRTGVGYDNVDVDAATQHGVAVAVTPGANRNSVAEHVFALMLSCARGIPEAVASVSRKEWRQTSGVELAGATLGVVGLGSIGKTVARAALALGMSVCAFDPFMDKDFATQHGITEVTLEGLLEQSDFVTLHLFLDEQTRHLIDATALSRMKPTAFLINTARGGIIDEVALVEALRQGQLAGAALDVLEVEPLGNDSPLREVPNLIITPHIAGATKGARARSAAMAADHILAFSSGEPIVGLINPEYSSAMGAEGPDEAIEV